MSNKKCGIQPIYGRSFVNASKRFEREQKAFKYDRRIHEADDFIPKALLNQRERTHGQIRPSRLNFQGIPVTQRIAAAAANKQRQRDKLAKKMKSKIPKKSHEI